MHCNTFPCVLVCLSLFHSKVFILTGFIYMRVYIYMYIYISGSIFYGLINSMFKKQCLVLIRESLVKVFIFFTEFLKRTLLEEGN